MITGMVGCFGGMSLAAALCSYLIVTREARLGMNGLEVIEQETGIEELDSSDRAMIWSLIGAEQRARVGMVDWLVEDDATLIAKQLREAVREKSPRHCMPNDQFFGLVFGASNGYKPPPAAGATLLVSSVASVVTLSVAIWLLAPH